jgi:hypothetical protein
MSNRSKRQQHEPRDRRWQNMPPRPPREPKAPELCAFCGYNEANTREHVFAKSLFLVANRSGILTPATSWTPEWERIDRVLRKITRGLFYHYMKRRMDVETAVIVRSRLNQETFDALAIDMKSANTLGPIGLGEKGAVIFSGARTSEACDDTMWLFNFYQVFGAFTLTLSRATAIKWGSA